MKHLALIGSIIVGSVSPLFAGALEDKFPYDGELASQCMAVHHKSTERCMRECKDLTAAYAAKLQMEQDEKCRAQKQKNDGLVGGACGLPPAYLSVTAQCQKIIDRVPR
jgi:hypothetical protein